MVEFSYEDVVEFELVGEEETYDLEVDHEDHTFFANDISVSNSHSVSYSIISFQCAWLLHYYPAEWMASFLDREPEKRKEQAINVAKSFGFVIEPMDINISGTSWQALHDGKTLVQPLTSIKGLGEKAVEQIMNNRPFKDIEDFLFNENVVYRKLNKKAIDVLVRSQALNCLMDERFTGLKHFWSAVAVDRPKTPKKFLEGIELYKPEGRFTDEELINFRADLTGFYPIVEVVGEELLQVFKDKYIPPISEYDPALGSVVWFVVRSKTVKQTKKGKDYWVLDVIDSTSKMTQIKCWGIKQNDRVSLNRPYMARLEKDNWGFSTRSVRSTFKLLK